MVNAFNMIDGINGLVLLLVFNVLQLYYQLILLSPLKINFYFVALAFSILGIFNLNFPFGRIFLGDGGAYLLGAMLSIGLIKVYQENNLSPWYVLTMLIYPFTDFVASVIRRTLSATSTLNADNATLSLSCISRLKKTGIKSDLKLHYLTTFIIFLFYMPFLIK